MSELGISGAAAGANEALKEARKAAKSVDSTSNKIEKTPDQEFVNKMTTSDKKEISNEGKAKGHVSIFDDPFSGKNDPPICVTPFQINEKMEKIFKTMIDSPKEAIEEIRNMKGAEKDNALLGFQSKIDKMSEFDLKNMRDYLVKAMSDPNNKDDQLLGSLLGKVNQELDSKDNNIFNEIDFGKIGRKATDGHEHFKNIGKAIEK